MTDNTKVSFSMTRFLRELPIVAQAGAALAASRSYSARQSE
jgi:hypothetical protein